MKSLASLALLSIVALAPAQTVQFARAYKVGDVDAYHLTIRMEGMAMEVAMDTSQKVVKVYDNGDADVETTVSNNHMKGMGMDRDLPSGPARKMRLSKFGTPVDGAKGVGTPMNMDMSQMLKLPQGGMSVGQTVDIDETDPTTKAHAKGTARLESLKDGVATLVTSLDVSSAGVPKPMHLEFTSQIEAASGRPTRIDGKISGLPGQAGAMGLTGMNVTMVRKG